VYAAQTSQPFSASSTTTTAASFARRTSRWSEALIRVPTMCVVTSQGGGGRPRKETLRGERRLAPLAGPSPPLLPRSTSQPYLPKGGEGRQGAMLQPSCRSTDDPTARRERLRHRLCIGAIRLTTNPRHSRGQGPHEAAIEPLMRPGRCGREMKSGLIARDASRYTPVDKVMRPDSSTTGHVCP
jgi:hypothetical protein